MKIILTLICLILALAAVAAAQQNLHNPDYLPDRALKANARVNPSTLAMELSIPLIGYTGRAGGGKAAVLNYSSKVWVMEAGPSWYSNELVTPVYPRFAQKTAAGWSSSLGPVRLVFSKDVYRDQGTGTAEMEGQIFTLPIAEDPQPDGDIFYVKRVQVHMPDGSTHEMRVNDEPIKF